VLTTFQTTVLWLTNPFSSTALTLLIT